MRKIILLLSIFPLHGATILAAETAVVRQGEAHLHGQVLLNIAVEDKNVVVELESPAINLLGFEHSPATVEERALVESVGSQVLDYASIIEFANGACTQKDVENRFLIFGEDEHAAEGHVRESTGGEEHEEEHGDIHLRYELECLQKNGLKVSFRAFADFPGIVEVVVQWISGTGQGGAVLTREMQSFHIE